MGNRRRRLPLELLVFVVGSATLGSEIAVARLIAPFFGDSTIVWANTIAVVLVALSIGYQYARVVEYPDGRRQLELNRRHVACTRPAAGGWPTRAGSRGRWRVGPSIPMTRRRWSGWSTSRCSSTPGGGR